MAQRVGMGERTYELVVPFDEAFLPQQKDEFQAWVEGGFQHWDSHLKCSEPPTVWLAQRLGREAYARVNSLRSESESRLSGLRRAVTAYAEAKETSPEYYKALLDRIDADLAKYEQLGWRREAYAFEAFRYGCVGWRELRDPDGAPLAPRFEVDEFGVKCLALDQAAALADDLYDTVILLGNWIITLSRVNQRLKNLSGRPSGLHISSIDAPPAVVTPTGANTLGATETPSRLMADELPSSSSV